MSIINKILVLTSIIALLLLTACEKDPIDKIVPLEPVEAQTQEQSENPLIKSSGKMSTEGFAIDCIAINYPFDFALESGATITVNNNDETEIALYSEDDYVIDFVYPVEAVDQDGNSLTINNVDELAEAFIECIPEDGWDDFEEFGFPAFDFEGMCVNIVYPLTLQSDNESTTTVNNEQEFANALANEFYYFSFPITVIDEEGNTLMMEDDMALMNALFDCADYYDPHTEICPFDFSFCFELIYPVTLVDESGNTSTVNDEDELYTQLFSGKVIDFVYPISLVLKDGTTLTADNETAFTELLTDCFDIEIDYPYYGYYGYDFCFEFDFPVQLEDYSGNVNTVNNDEELNAAFYSEAATFVYPITVTFEDGNVTTVNNDEELNQLIIDCWYGDYEETPTYFFPFVFCFAIEYPAQLVDSSGNISTVSSEEELSEAFYSNEVIDFVYPITITMEDGTTTSVSDQNELSNIISDCPYQGYEEDYEEEYEDYEGEYDLDIHGFFDLLFTLELSCLDLNFPITMTVDNEENTMNDTAEFEAAVFEIFSSDLPQEIDINFPITATLNSDGSVITINEESDVLNYIYNCP